MGSSIFVTRALMRVAPQSAARRRRKLSSTSRRTMEMNSWGLSVFPKSTMRFEGEMIFIWVTLRSIRWEGMLNSSSIQRGMAPPQGFAASGLRSKINVSMPLEARASAADDPAGPPPITATRNVEVITKEVVCLHLSVWGLKVLDLKV